MITKNNGFSLVELSIVLVILGLLTGGILGGQSLIKAAEMRAVTTEYESFTVAKNTFQQKYFAIPGDMPNATRFWGTMPGATAGDPSSCPDDGSDDTSTCDGNGNGYVENAVSESQHVWKHLANAGLVAGNYTGEYADDLVAGVHGPKSKFRSGIWGWGNSQTSHLFGLTPSNTLTIGRPLNGNGSIDEGLFTPEEVWNIDTKFDDGAPSTGNIRNFGAQCQSADEYVFTITTEVCMIGFLQ